MRRIFNKRHSSWHYIFLILIRKEFPFAMQNLSFQRFVSKRMIKKSFLKFWEKNEFELNSIDSIAIIC